jgi:hypothetical protein
MTLSPEQADLLRGELFLVLDQVRTPEARVQYSELLTAVDLGEIPVELLPTLQVLLEVGLESGRIRARHLADGESAALGLYRQTPAGRARSESAAEVNRALAALTGRPLEALEIQPAGPGRFHLTLTTGSGTLLLALDRAGVRVRTVEVG